MDDQNFMENFKAKDIYSFINYHIKDLVNVRNKLDEKMLNQLEKSWDKYSYENYLNRDEYKALRIAKVQVVNAEKGNFDDSIRYYDRAIEIDSGYTKAYLNAAALILEREGPMIEEMNSLGMSTADYNRYDELKIERENLYKSAIPYLEKVYALENDNLNAARTLKNIYSALGDTYKENEYKAIVAELENR